MSVFSSQRAPLIVIGVLIAIVLATVVRLLSLIQAVPQPVCSKSHHAYVPPGTHSNGGLVWNLTRYREPPSIPVVSREEVCAKIGGCVMFPRETCFPEGEDHSPFYHFNDHNFVKQEALVEFYMNFPYDGKYLDAGAGVSEDFRKFKGWYEYHRLDVRQPDNTEDKVIMCDLHKCDSVPDGYYDVIHINAVYEHLAEPWTVTAELSRMLRPGGLLINSAFFSTRWHPSGIFGDHYRYTHNAYIHLHEKVGGLKTLDVGYDISGRRMGDNLDIQRRNPHMHDWAPSDGTGAWKEFWTIYYVGLKPVIPNTECGCDYCLWKRGGSGLADMNVPHRYAAQPRSKVVVVPP